MSKYKKIAIILHGLTHTDRGWLLKKLPEAVAKKVRPLLLELKELGIPSDKSLLNAVLQEASSIDCQNNLIAKAAAYDSKTIFECLKIEPALLIQRLMSITQWQWMAEVKTKLVKNGKKLTSNYSRPENIPKKLNRADMLILQAFVDELDNKPTNIQLLAWPESRVE